MSKEKKGSLKANSDLLDSLHQMVAKDLINRIASGEATVQELSAAIKYLKDNDITADVHVNSNLRYLEQEVTSVSELPFLGDEDTEATYGNVEGPEVLEDTCGHCETPCGNEHCVTKESV